MKVGRLLNISIVLYRTPEDEWKPLVEELLRSKNVNKIYLIDNSPEESVVSDQLSAISVKQSANSNQQSVVSYLHPGKNLGYGAANNIAIRETIYDDIPYHLVINSDIQVKAEAIDNLLTVMQSNGLIGQLMPRVNGTCPHLAT